MTVLVVAACAPPEPTFDQVLEDLRACPAGDGPWRSAIDAVDGEDDLRSLLELCLSLAASHPDRWEPPWTAGRCRTALEQDEPPDDLFRKALENARRTGDLVGVARSADDLAWLSYIAGDLPRGEELYEEALAAAIEAGRRDLTCFIRSNLAALLREKGDYPGCREQLELAETGLTELGLVDATRGALYNRGVVLYELGDALGAEEVFRRVHGEAVEVGDGWSARYSASYLGHIHLLLGEGAEARRWYERIPRDDTASTFQADLGLGKVSMSEGDFAAAVNSFQRAAEGARGHDRLLELTAESFLAEAEMMSGTLDTARRRLEQVIAECDRTNAEETGWYARRILGKVHLREGRSDAAAHVLRRAVEMLESHGAPLDPLGEGLHFLRERADPYADLAAALAAGDVSVATLSEILELAQRSRARALRRAQATGQRGRAVGAALEEIQRGLAEGDLLLNYLIGEERGVVLAITPELSRVARIDGRRQLAELVRRYREALRRQLLAAGDAVAAPDPRLVASATLLRERLLEPVADELARARRLWIVPDRDLALVSFAALPMPAAAVTADDAPSVPYVGERMQTAVLPVAGPPPRWDDVRAPVLLAGRPQLDADAGFPPLPFLAYELDRVQAVWSAGSPTSLLGSSFSRTGLQSLPLQRFKTIHLATHAVASSRDPRRCGIILSGGERLGIDAIAGFRLDSPLVVLSACSTGEGELLPGEGVVGLGWAFLRAGAQGVVVSLWTVDDATSATLMVTFHRFLRDGADPMAALSRARQQLALQYPHPAFWAPFVLVAGPGSD